MDTKNTTEIDFIGLMASYLDRVNFDPEFFLTLLLECESTKVSHFYRIYKCTLKCGMHPRLDQIAITRVRSPMQKVSQSSMYGINRACMLHF